MNENEEVDIKRYYLKILEGFDEFMYFIMKHKDECIKMMSIFSGKKVRCLVKGTEKYASMIRYANHPAYNREMKYRERLMMNIWAYPYHDKRIIKSEVHDLLFNDIPIFYTYVDSRDIIDSKGIVYKNFHKTSGMDLVINRINGLTEENISRQRSILLTDLGIPDSWLNQTVRKREIVFSAKTFCYLKQAKGVADEMMREAFVKDNKCSFISIDCDEEKHWKLVPCDESLYGGLSGISVFFLELYRKTENEIYFNYYQMLIRAAIEQTQNTGFQSAFTGWLSPIYPLILEYKYFSTVSDKKFLDFTIRKLESLDVEDINKFARTDYISGIAGIIRLLTMVQAVFGKQYPLKKVIWNFSDVLTDRINSKKDKSMNTIGIAHGISGIMLGLASGGLVNPEFVKQMLLKEQQMKIAHKNIYKWCWGLSGMIQARLELLKIIPMSIDQEQLNQLIKKFYKSLSCMWNQDCLCHGNASVAITIKMIYEYTNDEKWRALLQLWMSNMNINALLEYYKIPSIGGTYAKGIFDGISGIGWTYLYSFSTVNNLLLLETNNG